MHDETQASGTEHPTAGASGAPSPEAPGSAATAAPVDAAVHAAALGRVALLESRLARAEEESRALVGAMRHAAEVAQRLLADAEADAEALRRTAEHDLATTRDQIRAHRESYLGEVQRQAAQILGEAQATAHELVVVARADARAAVHEERRRAAHELEMLAAVRERVAEERRSLTTFHAQLSNRLRHLVHAMVDFSDEPGGIGEGELLASTVLTGPQRPRLAPAADPTPVAEPEARTYPSADRSSIHAADDQLDRAFAEFFSDDVDDDPSRRWILDE